MPTSVNTSDVANYVI
jgi:hypothetical protein